MEYLEITPDMASDTLLDYLDILLRNHNWDFQLAGSEEAFYNGLAHADEINYIRNVLHARGQEWKNFAEQMMQNHKPLGGFRGGVH